MLVVSSNYDMSTFPYIQDMQERYKELIHDNNMREMANAYYYYKMQLVSNYNMLDIPNSSNIYINTTLKSFNVGKIYLHTPRVVNIGLASIAIMRIKYMILPCLVFTFVPLNIFIDSLYTLIRSLLESSKLFWSFLLDNIINFINNKKHRLILLILKWLIIELQKKNNYMGEAYS